MNKSEIYLLIITLLFSYISISCRKSQEKLPLETEYVIFGHYFGECLGEECIETYLLTSTRLYEDLTDDLSKTYPFEFVQLEDSKFEQVKDFYNAIPYKLIITNDSTFGFPDSRDQGGIYLRYVKGGMYKTWYFDSDTTGIPDYAKWVVEEVKKNVYLINK